MVKFRLHKEDERYAVYWYFPEGKLDGKRGVIVLDKVEGTINIKELAPDDFQREISVEELNSLRDSINEMRRESGDREFTEEECPSAKEPEISTFYADHAVSKIVEAWKNGEVINEGMSAWY